MLQTVFMDYWWAWALLVLGLFMIPAKKEKREPTRPQRPISVQPTAPHSVTGRETQRRRQNETGSDTGNDLMLLHLLSGDSDAPRRSSTHDHTPSSRNDTRDDSGGSYSGGDSGGGGGD